jgi:NADH-quinone oxidoreductase subunit D
MVRIAEMRESVTLCRQVLEGMPEGEWWGKVPKIIKLPVGEVYVRTENPRGELGFYIVSRGGKEPWRLKCRAPSFHNINAIQAMAPGHLIADIIAMVGSLDIVLGEVDR